MDIEQVKQLADELCSNMEKVIIGRNDVIDMVIASVLCGGHILMEDVPGSGKTMLAKTLAKSISGDFKRIQLTPDLLPADITGINYFNMKISDFQFQRGPVFTNILIADEINRATPKTQAGLLECMEEKQVTVDGNTYKLSEPFVVIATQNPVDTQGVFPLPEAQMDRFLVKLNMKYPEHDATVDVLKTHLRDDQLDKINAVATIAQIMEAREAVKKVEVHDDMFEYVTNILEASRNNPKIVLGLSQRAGLALLRMSMALAAMEGRTYIMPDDIKKASVSVCTHRLVLKNSERIKKNADNEIMQEILQMVEVPAE